MEIVGIEEARERAGLRLVYVAGVPSPWGEAAKGIFHVKQIPFAAVRMNPGDQAITEWTGSSSAPVVFYDAEPPRSGWAEILLLAERLAPKPALLPESAADRVLVFGLSHEICGEMGLGWARRIEGVYDSIASNGAVGFPLPVAKYLGQKYGYRADDSGSNEGGNNGLECKQRVIDLLGMLAGRLWDQREKGSRYYVGSSLTAADIYSATFLALFSPLPPEQCAMSDGIRAAFEAMDERVSEALAPILVEHRDAVYAEHLALPLTL